MNRNSVLIRRKGLKSRVGLKRGGARLRQGGSLASKSIKQEQVDREWLALTGHLIIHRAGGKDEITGKPHPRCELGGHHIKPRPFNIHNAGNCLICDSDTHDHQKYGNGIPISRKQELLRVAGLNKKYGIDLNMTVADV